jgi:hypothetical protein
LRPKHHEIEVTSAKVELAGKLKMSNVLPRFKSFTHGERAQIVNLLKMGQQQHLVRLIAKVRLANSTSEPLTQLLVFEHDVLYVNNLIEHMLMFAVLNVDAMVRSSLPHGGLFP